MKNIFHATTALTTVTSIMLLTTPINAIAQDAGEAGGFESFSLDQLADMEVTSVSKKSEKASEAAAAIYVISNEDIRRSGATSIPEALRGAPGLQVAQANSHVWSVSVRGFNDHFANKLLVLIDGRTIYTPLFSGVHWDSQDTPLDDVERIEIIRGPGATLWGANAVNGVINIITKNSADTQGGLAKAGLGNEEHGFGTVRYGGKLSENATYRAYVKYFNRDEATDIQGFDARDPLENSQAGFRTDWKIDGANKLTVQGDMYNAKKEDRSLFPTLSAPFVNPVIQETLMSGMNILSRYSHSISETSEVTLQSYIDRVVRQNDVLDESRTTFDLDMQHAFNAGERHEFIWGLGYRLISDDLEGSFVLDFTPEERTNNLFSAFVQDKIELLADEVFLTLGSKFEHNDYTGFELQPSARLSWLINNRQTFWTSVSRAVRTPNRASDDISLAAQVLPTPIPTLLRQAGDRSAESEELTAYEIGYRIQPRENLSFDIATFYNDYDKLFSNRIGAPRLVLTPSPHGMVPVTAQNLNSGVTYGIEVSSNWDVTDAWQLGASYSLLKTELDLVAATQVTTEGNSPEQQFAVRSHVKLPHNLELSNALSFTDQLPGERIGDYVRFDARLGWKPMENVELSVSGQNLLDNHHPEFTPFIYNEPSQVDRSIYASVAVRF